MFYIQIKRFYWDAIKNRQVKTCRCVEYPEELQLHIGGSIVKLYLMAVVLHDESILHYTTISKRADRYFLFDDTPDLRSSCRCWLNGGRKYGAV